MPVNEKSYQNGKVYRIWSLDTNDIYVGSTSDTLSNRFCRHKKDYKLWKEGDKRRYCSSYILFDQVGVDNCKIELIKNFPCNSKTELHREEGRVMRENKEIIVNKRLAGRTQKEYDEEHKEKNKEYRDEHKEEKKEYNKEYYEEHKEKIIEKNKEYYEEHKEKRKEKRKEYYEHHKEEISEKMKEYHKEYYQERKGELNKKYKCNCGGNYTHQHKSTHEKTQKHQDYLKFR